MNRNITARLSKTFKPFIKVPNNHEKNGLNPFCFLSLSSTISYTYFSYLHRFAKKIDLRLKPQNVIALSEFKLLKLFKIAVIFFHLHLLYEVLVVYCEKVMSDGIVRAWRFVHVHLVVSCMYKVQIFNQITR